jgi:hypothetical protein
VDVDRAVEDEQPRLGERDPLKSLGRAVVDVATSGSEPAPKPRDR